MFPSAQEAEIGEVGDACHTSGNACHTSDNADLLLDLTVTNHTPLATDLMTTSSSSCAKPMLEASELLSIDAWPTARELCPAQLSSDFEFDGIVASSPGNSTSSEMTASMASAPPAEAMDLTLAQVAASTPTHSVATTPSAASSASSASVTHTLTTQPDETGLDALAKAFSPTAFQEPLLFMPQAGVQSQPQSQVLAEPQPHRALLPSEVRRGTEYRAVNNTHARRCRGKKKKLVKDKAAAQLAAHQRNEHLKTELVELSLTIHQLKQQIFARYAQSSTTATAAFPSPN
eukprot:m.10758 g.10758  ORF g.10758 m.10758 type:complete len:289 (+) comp5616_c0_seq1:370-1236(+)